MMKAVTGHSEHHETITEAYKVEAISKQKKWEGYPVKVCNVYSFASAVLPEYLGFDAKTIL